MNDRNVLYFALEALEGAIMQEWIHRLGQGIPGTSMLLRGDALWLHNAVPRGYVHQEFFLAAGRHGVGDIFLRTAPLVQEYLARIPPGGATGLEFVGVARPQAIGDGDAREPPRPKRRRVGRAIGTVPAQLPGYSSLLPPKR